MSQPLLKFDGVSKSYVTATREMPAIRGLSLSVGQGEYVTVTGPSGSGKSTFLHMAGCLDTPTSGTVYIDGTDVGALTDDGRARLRATIIGFVFQQFNLLPRLSALENVALPLLYTGIARAERYQRAARMLEQVGLRDHAARYPNQLSGGEQQRVAIARALIGRPRLLLADEPTGSLDTKTGRGLMDTLRTLNEGGIAIVLVTHEAAVARAGRRRIQFCDGRLVTEESTREQYP